MKPRPTILQVQNLRKEFPGVLALAGDGSLCLFSGEVYGLVGENGAGKSTLMKILAGVYQPDGGQILMRAREVRWKNVPQAQRHGVVMIHQEFNLVDELSVAANIFLGREKTRAGVLRQKSQRQQAATLLQRLHADIDPRQRVADLSVAQKQLVEIAKAISCEASLLIMDEPTAVLTQHETQALFELIGQLRQSGVTIIYISHILPEVLRICDRLSVMRDGRLVRQLDETQLKQTTEKELASMMVGRPMADHFPPRQPCHGSTILKVTDLSGANKVSHINLELRRGEILGLAGLVGAGRTELGEMLCGIRPSDSGLIELEGKSLSLRCPADGLHAHLAYLSEDRKGSGLTLAMSMAQNTVMASLRKYGRVFVSRRKQNATARGFVRQMRIKVADIAAPVGELSGGNQQKVALAKWMDTQPRVLILDEPTRGVDIGAKEEIYRLIRDLAAQGMACLLISSEFNELLGMCHRIGVMRNGHLAAMVDATSATEESLMHLAAGV